MAAGRERGNRRGARGFALLVLLALLALAGAQSAPAGTTYVIADGDVGGLIAAISDANSETGINVGTDTIELATGGTYTLTGINNIGGGGSANGFPVITSDIVIEGHGATIRRSTAGGVPSFRIFDVDSGGSLTLHEVTVRNGRANNGAGIRTFGPLVLERSTIANNVSTADAGGVYAAGSLTLTVTNSTFSGNVSGASGGALYVAGAPVASFINTTITGNSAASDSGGIGNSSLSTSYQNTIVAGNTAPSQADCGSLQPLTSNGNNLVGLGTGCTTGPSDLTTSNPAAELDPTLADNGGPTPTHALVAGSQAIDAGADVACPPADQRGQARVDGNADTVVTCDIGSFELVSANSDLSNLTISAGTLAPSFDSATTSYDAGTVPNATSSLTVKPTAAELYETIQARVNGGAYGAVASGSPSGSLALDVGLNTVEVLVTAQDGTTATSYSVTITRAPSSNADLSNLTISAGTLAPSFDSATTSYDAGTVPNTTASVKVTPTVAESNATIQARVNGGAYGAVASGSPSGSLALDVGLNTVEVLVTAQDGTTATSYSVTITRAPSSNADLSNLTISAGTLSPAFNRATTSYDAGAVANAIGSVRVTPTAAESNATIQARVNGGAYGAVASGSPSGSLALDVGLNTVDVLVTAQDGTTATSYSITITRAPSSNADLSNLTISAGTLSPAFNRATTSYDAGAVANAIGSVRVTPTAAESHATIRVKVNRSAFQIVASGAQSGPLALRIGASTIQLMVTAQDGTAKTYSITITRVAVGGGTISGSFACAGKISGLTVRGALTVPAGMNCRLTGGRVNRAVQVLRGASFWGSGDLSIGGSFNAVDAAWVKLDQVGVAGDVKLSGLTALPPGAVASSICSSSIGGALQVTSNTSRISIGDNPPCGAGGGNTITRSVTVRRNNALVRVSRNSIGGALACSGNTPAASGVAASNTAASKSGECAAL